MHKPPIIKSQQGVVIIIALFVVALVATMSYVMMARLARDTHRTALILRNIQAEAYAQGSLNWAIEQLKNNWLQQKPHHIIDVIPLQSPVNTINGYQVVSTIEDMQSKFNLNNIKDPESQKNFKRLLMLIVPNMNETLAQNLTLALADWISPTSQQLDYNKYYAARPVPYRAAHQSLVSMSELNLVRGFSPAIVSALLPYVTALPDKTSLNIQTASGPLFAMFSPTLPLEGGYQIEKLRQQTPFVDMTVFNQLAIVKNHAFSTNDLTVTSAYFLVKTNVTIENQQLLLYTLLERTAGEGKASIRIVWQRKGVW